jgi:hypothetical protein
MTGTAIARNPAATAAGAVFGGLASLRHRRSLHPDGASYHATVRIDGDERYAGPEQDGGGERRAGLTRPGGGHGHVPLLARPRAYPALLRFSRGLGLPPGLPDALGVAVRFCDVHGEGRHQDLLMTTSARPPVLHHLLLPALRGPFGQPYSTILPYRVGDGVRLFGALPLPAPARDDRTDLEEFDDAAARGEARFTLALAAPFRGWRPIGVIEAGEPLDREAGEALRFNPWNTGGGIRPVGPFQGLRDAAYGASQRARLNA